MCKLTLMLLDIVSDAARKRLTECFICMLFHSGISLLAMSHIISGLTSRAREKKTEINPIDVHFP